MQVIDTNIIVYLLLQGDRTTAARALFTKDPDWRSDSFEQILEPGSLSVTRLPSAPYRHSHLFE